MTPNDPLTLLERREIEAKIAGPIVRAFAQEVGQERAIAILKSVIEDLARASGADLAQALGADTLEAFAQGLDRWKQGGALELDILVQNDRELAFNVTRCRYAEMYQALGLADLGFTLSCTRDFQLVAGFNPDITLARTQTIMQGAGHCDFRFRHEPGRASERESNAT